MKLPSWMSNNMEDQRKPGFPRSDTLPTLEKLNRGGTKNRKMPRSSTNNFHPAPVESPQLAEREVQRKDVEGAIDIYFDRPDDFLQLATSILSRPYLIPGYRATLEIFVGYHSLKLSFSHFRKALETCDGNIKKALEKHMEIPDEVVALRRSAIAGLKGEKEFMARQMQIAEENWAARDNAGDVVSN